ncbi:MAG: choice-of-anchor D domain-containing protein [Vicinamibacteria bacterium]
MSIGRVSYSLFLILLLATTTSVANAANADLAVLAVRESKDPVLVGEIFDYFIDVRNNGPAEARVGLVNNFPSNLSFLGSQYANCSPLGGELRCAIGSLKAGESRTVRVIVLARSAGLTTLSVTILSTEPDPNSVNNSGSVTTLVGAPASPVLTVTPASLSFGSVPVTSSKDLTVTVKNVGGSTLTGSASASAPFAIVGAASYSLAANQAAVLTVRFSPTAIGASSGALSLTGGGGGSVSLSGTGADFFFHTPAQTTGSLSVKLYPTEGVTPGARSLVTFGVPFPRGSVTPANLSKVRVLKGGAEIPAHVGMLTPWRHARNTNVDGKSVRVARIQIRYEFTVTYPSYETITVQWGTTARSLNVATLVPPRNGWHLVSDGTFVSADGVYEPDVYAVLPSTHLVKGILRPGRMTPMESTVLEARANPATMDATATWPRAVEQEHAAVNNFYSIINEDDPLVTPANECHYKTDYDAWLYDRAAAMFTLYFRTGFPKPLREAVRATEFYRSQIYPGGTLPARSVGLFRLKNPDPSAFGDPKYSYNESFAYSYWLTGDDVLLPYFDWVVNAHEQNAPPVRWSASLGFWTERSAAFRLLANVVAYEVTGSATYKSRLLSQTADLIWHQNGAGGVVPVGVDGGLYHYGSQHGDGTPTAFVASPWMTVLLVDAMVRAYAFTGDPLVSGFVKRTGTFFKAAVKSDTDHLYGGAALYYPDYMTGFDGATDVRSGSDVEHALDVSASAAWAFYFSGAGDASLRQLVVNLYRTYDVGVNYWIRPTAPQSGLTAYRVSPWRKYAWEHRPSGSLSLAMGMR